MITAKTYKALKILEHTRNLRVMTAKDFALAFWGNDESKQYLFTAVSNSGNGACSGKKAWLCAGSYLSALYKRKLVVWRPRCDYHPTERRLDCQYPDSQHEKLFRLVLVQGQCWHDIFSALEH